MVRGVQYRSRLKKQRKIQFFTIFVQLSTGIILSLFSLFFRLIFELLIYFLKYENESQTIKSSIWINTVISILNSSLLLLMVNSSKLEMAKRQKYTDKELLEFGIYGRRGLVNDIWSVMVANMVAGPLPILINLEYLYKLYQRRRYRRSSNKEAYSQMEVNQIFEGTSPPVVDFYISNFKTLALSLIYAPVLPISLLFGFITCFLQYLAFKYYMLYIDKCPKEISASVFSSVYRGLDILIFLLCLFRLYS